MNKNILAVALASLLVGGVAVAAYQSFQGDDAPDNGFADGEQSGLLAGLDGDEIADGSIRGLEYADVTEVAPVTEEQELFAAVIGTDPVTETSTTSSPRQVCNDVVVQDRLPERDGNVGGTVVGAIVGGALGNQVGDGSGQKAATVAGAVAGGFAGRAIDRRHVGGQVVQRVETECRTVSDTSQSTHTVGYNVTYRNPDGTTGTMRMGSKPGDKVSLGTEEKVVGYDVTYRYQGQQQTVRLDEKPGERLPVIDGEVVTRTAVATEADAGRG